jgi:hypothetical protein
MSLMVKHATPCLFPHICAQCDAKERLIDDWWDENVENILIPEQEDEGGNMSEGPQTDSEVTFFDSIITSALVGVCASDAIVLVETDRQIESWGKWLEQRHRLAVHLAQIALDARRKRKFT